MANVRARREERRERGKVSARKTAEDHKSGFQSKSIKIPDGVRLFIIKAEGVKRLEIIPYTVPEGSKNPNAEPGEMHFESTFWVHRDIGPDGDAYPCLKKTFGEACPICDFRAELLRDPDADENQVKNLAPKERQLWNVYDLDDPAKGVQLWDISFHLFGKQLYARVNNSDEEDNYEFFADPDEGMTLKVGFKEESFGGNAFFTTQTIDFKQRKEPLSDEILDKASVLDSLINHYDYDELKAVFLQTSTKKSDEEVREPAKGSSDTPRKRPKPEEEDDEEEEAPKKKTKPSDEEEERPAKRRRPEPKDEEEEEETPPKREGKSDSKESRTDERKSAKSAEKSSEQPKTKESDAAKSASPSKKSKVKVNDIVDHDEWGECSVIKISSDGSAVYILDKDDKKHSVDPSELTVVEFEDEPEEEKPAPKKKSAEKEASSKKSKAKEEKEEDDEEWDDDWDDEDEKD